MRLHLSAEMTFQDRNKKNGYLSDTDTNLVGINPKFTSAPLVSALQLGAAVQTAEDARLAKLY